MSRCIDNLKRNKADAKIIFDANVILAESLEAMGQLQNAFQLYLSVSQMTEKQHVGALLGYARIGYTLSLVALDDVFIVLLNAIALRKNDDSVKTLFAKMIQEEKGFDKMKTQMHDAWSDAAAVVYIATFLRECGLLDISLTLLEHAHRLCPKSVDIVLLTVHVMENKCELNSALRFIAEFLDKKLDRQVLRKIDLSCFVAMIQALLSNKTEELEKLIHGEHEVKLPSPTGRFSDIELQLLAVYFTVIKILFIQGRLDVIPCLLKIVQPLFSMQTDLHKTLIRNEQAYYSCISKLFGSLPPTPKQDTKKMYVVGDSHVLPLAWRSLIIDDIEYTIVPVLVTGVKIWHLRKDSKFYTKSSFQRSVKNIPSGCPVIFLMGEIDCREGIENALQNCLYDTLQESMNRLNDIYLNVLLDTKKRKKFKIFVHPIPNVLKETNVKVVQQFNTLLRDRVKGNSTNLKWLDVERHLLDEKNGLLKEQFHFDGVHIHPKYLSLIQECV